MSLEIDLTFCYVLPGGGSKRRFDCPVCREQSPKSRDRNTMVLFRSTQHDAVILYCHRGSCVTHGLSKTGQGITLATYLRSHQPTVFAEYQEAKRQCSGNVRTRVAPPSPPPEAEPQRLPVTSPAELLEYVRAELPSVFDLDSDHPARRYVEGRRIPERWRDHLLWDEAFAHTAELLDGKQRRPEARLVIPYLSRDGRELTAILGRTLDPDVLPKYSASKTHPDNMLLFGLERVNTREDIVVVEGPIDSLFLTNAVSTTSTNLTKAADVLPRDRLILAYDNQPAVVAAKMLEAARQGFRIFLWPIGTHAAKDFNEAVLRGYEPEYLDRLIRQNVCAGQGALARIQKWSNQ